MSEHDANQTAAFDIRAIAASFPPSAQTLLLDTRLTDREAASARVFRVYRPTPPHFHATCDEYLFCLSGRVTFWAGREDGLREVGPGELLFFSRGTVHAMPTILEEPLVFLSVDTPRRDPSDVIFVNPADGTPDTFIKPIEATY